MKKVLSILILAATLIGCGNAEVKDVTAVTDSVSVLTPEPAITGGFNAKIAEAPLANPVFMYGSDFLTLFKSLRKMGKYDDMIKFTSSATIERIGKDSLRDFYENKYKNVSNVKLASHTENDNGTITLNYTNINMATKNAIAITVVVESDTAKLILYDLKKFPN